MAKREVVIPYSPRHVFESLHERSTRWAAVVAHRRCGKTVACINDLIRRAFQDQKQDGRYAYVAPYHSQAKAIAWDYLLRYSEPVRTRENASELWVELLNGARIRLFGADNPDSLRGLYFDGVILDEYADMRPRVWGEIIRPLLADRKGWAVFIGTPKGHNAFWEIHQQAQRDPAWIALTLTASGTGILDEEELADARRSMSQDQYEQEFECSFEAAILGAYFGKEMRRAAEEGRILALEYDEALPVHTAWDLGYSDDTAIWWYQVVRGEIHLLDFHSSHGHPVKYYADVIKRRPYQYGTHWLPHDARAKTMASGGKSVIEQLAAEIGLENLKIVPNLSVQDGIQAARVAIDRSWFDADKCMEGLECLRQYQREFDEDKKVFRDIPRHDWTSHGADAFRMLAVAWQHEQPPALPRDAMRGIVVGQPSVTLEELWRSTPKQSGRI